jgi:hypothetical protein
VAQHDEPFALGAIFVLKNRMDDLPRKVRVFAVELGQASSCDLFFMRRLVFKPANAEIRPWIFFVF